MGIWVDNVVIIVNEIREIYCLPRALCHRNLTLARLVKETIKGNDQEVEALFLKNDTNRD